MAVEGNLKDISLANLIQMICQEGNAAVLFLKYEGQRGALYFDQGELLHAATGTLVGEEAVYRMLSWSSGTFRLSEHGAKPQRSIQRSWTHLLIEGARLLDEQRAQTSQRIQAEQALSAEQIRQDSLLESDLTHLLSRLEHARARLAEGKTLSRPALALTLLSEIVHQGALFAEKLCQKRSGQPKIPSLYQTVERLGSKYPALRLLQANGERQNIQNVADVYKNWKGDASRRSQTFQQISNGLLEVLNFYFTLTLRCFYSPSIAAQWQETVQPFLADLAQVVSEIQF